jgi:hypothetical protein
VPLYFEKREVEDGVEIWQTNGQYWKDREKGEWTKSTIIY